MPGGLVHKESWKRMVLRATPPAWLAKDAPHGDVVLSSRSRVARNLAGYRFPHSASAVELAEILSRVAAVFPADLGYELLKELDQSELDYLVGSRLCSPDFKAGQIGRALLLDRERTASIMVNEEDHVRIQALTAGWSVATADAIARQAEERLGERVRFAYSPRFGYLAASPYNAGEGRRLSVMFHLIGLAHAKRLPSVLKALSSRNLVARGLFGESSRAVAAFLQVSITDAAYSGFTGACEYLIREEREARSEVGTALLREKALQALDFVQASRTVSLADALRVLGYCRWGAAVSAPGLERSPRDVDLWLTTLELQSFSDDPQTMRQRADFLRDKLT
jgi:protein arginine kinase